MVQQMFPPATRAANIKKHLPAIVDALQEASMDDRDLVLMALATIRAESENFEPINEGKSKYNTGPAGPPFNLYDGRLGNGPGDGARFKGRGFIQLTGRENYAKLSTRLGLGTLLVDDPAKANNSKIAARILASFIKKKGTAIKYALYGGDLKYARRVVNGGVHGLERFVDAFTKGQRLLGTCDDIAPAAPAPISAAARPMEITVDRFISDSDTTVSRVLIDGNFQCFGLEDEYREEKLAEETRIPSGRYSVRLRTSGGFHRRYSRRYGAMHRGMLHIQDVPNFTFILIHCGNTDEDTAGCLLVGTDATTQAGEMRVNRSRAAYESLYPLVVDAADRGELTIAFKDNDRGV